MHAGRTSCRSSKKPSAPTCGGRRGRSRSARRSSSRTRATARRTRRSGKRARGGRAGNRVGIWAHNRHEWVVIQFATARVGAILVTINPAYQAAELHYALEKAGVSLLMMAAYDVPLPPGLDAVVLDRDWDAFLAGAERGSGWELAAR